MKYFKFLVFCGFVTFLFGCATGAKMENMTYGGVGVEQKNYDKSLKNEISFSSILGGKKTNPLWTSEISNDEFSEAVKKSLAEQGLLSDTGRYHLTVNLLEVKQPLIGLGMTVTTHVKYILRDSISNNIVLDKVVVASYTASFGDSFVAVKRLRLANEGSGKKNIEGLLEELSKLKIKPQEVSIKD